MVNNTAPEGSLVGQLSTEPSSVDLEVSPCRSVLAATRAPPTIESDREELSSSLALLE